MSEDQLHVMFGELPLAATTVKGRTRAAMTAELLSAADAGRVRIAIGRASDFFGAGVTETTLGERVFANALAGKRADFLGNPDLPHTYSYVPDVAVGLATLGTDERAVNEVWHLPGPETVTTQELAEMAYEFAEPFVLDTSKYQSTFGASGTPLPAAIASTVTWYRSRTRTPNPPQEGPTPWPAQSPAPRTPSTAPAARTVPTPDSDPSSTPPPASGSNSPPSPRTATKT
jgi:nucleoside-diphosphate-sugar epimerase